MASSQSAQGNRSSSSFRTSVYVALLVVLAFLVAVTVFVIGYDWSENHQQGTLQNRNQVKARLKLNLSDMGVPADVIAEVLKPRRVPLIRQRDCAKSVFVGTRVYDKVALTFKLSIGPNCTVTYSEGEQMPEMVLMKKLPNK